jgi:hypothetical protein
MSTRTKSKRRFRRAAVTLVTVAAFVVAPAAAFGSGGDPTDAEYDSTLTQISAGGPQPPAPTTPSAEAPGGSLPFTGLDVAAMAAVAGGLGLAGFAMRRRVLRSDSTS